VADVIWRFHMPQLHVFQEAFVHELLATDQLKAAVFSVKELGLVDSFPDLERQYRSAVVAQMLERGRWAVATRFAADDVDLQKQVGAPLFCVSCRII
jgi:hypothetical protein